MCPPCERREGEANRDYSRLCLRCLGKRWREIIGGFVRVFSFFRRFTFERNGLMLENQLLRYIPGARVFFVACNE